MKRLALISLLACACGVPEPIWQGEHLHYGTTTRAPVCHGSFHRQEQHAVELARLLEFELPEPIHFTRIKSRQILHYCGRSRYRFSGCALLDAPYVFRAGTSFDFHEITHAVAFLGEIQGPLPFAEGLAEVFDDGTDLILSGTPLTEVLDGAIEDSADYHTAGRFVRFLIERHDLLTLADFMRATALDDSLEDYSPVFAEVFGEPIETAIAEFESYPECSSVSNEISIVNCTLPTQPWDGASVTLTANVACDEDDVLGPDSHNMMITTRGLVVDQAGSYRLSPSDSSELSSYRLVKCGSCWDHLEVSMTPGVAEVHDLTPGRYYVKFGRRLDEPAELSLRVEQL